MNAVTTNLSHTVANIDKKLSMWCRKRLGHSLIANSFVNLAGGGLNPSST